MSWVELCGEAPEVTIKENLSCHWNAATNMMLKCPRKVQIFYDADGNRLGFRRIRANTDCLQVHFDGSDYTIASRQHLENADISLDEAWHAAPHMPAPPVPPDDPGDDGIVWIVLP